MKLLALLLALAIPGIALAQQAPPPDPPDARYVVKKGENLYNLGQRYFARPSDYETVRRLNKIPDGRRLQPGRTVVVPYRVMKTNAITAELVAFSGAVRIERGGQVVAPRVGLPIVEGMRLTTLANGFLTVELSDESRITLPSNSSARVRQLREAPMTGGLLRVFDLESGRSSTSATPNANPNSRFLIRTPLSVSAVRGTEFRVAALSDGQATTEVLKGLVGVAGAKDEVAVPETFGVSVTPAAVSAPTELPAKPKLVRGGKAQEDTVVAFEIEPVPAPSPIACSWPMTRASLTSSTRPRPTRPWSPSRPSPTAPTSSAPPPSTPPAWRACPPPTASTATSTSWRRARSRRKPRANCTSTCSSGPPPARACAPSASSCSPTLRVGRPWWTRRGWRRRNWCSPTCRLGPITGG
uniref:FecR domain-containing protein n=1 Tax=Phenylobacterium glaciei TaxID=2803784 RepID=A0A974P352_9CAUL|nr:FecR domain-containing protein [Phenylobacterium glaciei]